MTQKSLGFVHLEWVCPYCKAKNKGTDTKCHSCGSPQPEDVEFQQPAQEKFITNEQELARAKAGADIHCAYCGTRNAATNTHCSQCGADLSEGTARTSGQKLGDHRDKPAPDITCQFCGTTNSADARKCSNCGATLAQPKPNQKEQAKTTPKKQLNYWVIGLVAVALLLTCGICAFLTMRTEDQTARVESVQWERSIDIEEFGPVERSNWEDEIPNSAYNVGSCSLREHHRQSNPEPGSEEVCGDPYTIDTGSGAGEVVQDCEYIIYENWCEYTIDEWRQVDTVQAQGADYNPYWPAINLQSDQREGDRDEVYIVYFSADGAQYDYSISNENEFNQYQPETEWILKVNTFGSVNDVVAP